MTLKEGCVRLAAISILFFSGFGTCGAAETLRFFMRYQEPTAEGSTRFHRLVREETCQPSRLAVIVCDMWDSHHSVNAVRRVKELAPRIDQLLKRLRADGALVIHAPSSCMPYYEGHPARLRALQIPASGSFPENINQWCDQIPSEEQAAYPLDQSAGGEDDDAEELERWADQLVAQGRNPRQPWLSQTELIEIDSKSDFISDSGEEIWSILEARQVSQVLMVGVHTNMCVLGRPFGLRRLASAGKKVALVRDLTDTMFDPRAWPYVNHFTGTDLIIDHIERYVCPTISSDQLLSGEEFRFSEDLRPQLTMLIAEDEYGTEETLPQFAAKHLGTSFRVTTAFGSESDRNRIISLDDVESADALLISVRRRWLPDSDMERIRQFARSGRPMIGIRTASHAFTKRTGKPPEGLSEWPEFDAEVWGGSYTNHYGNSLRSTLAIADSAEQHPILRALGGPLRIQPGGSLYRTNPLAPGTQCLLEGSVPDQPVEPVAWTYVRPDGGRSFYTSLGHVEDFQQLQFQTLLAAGIHWACKLPLPDAESVRIQNVRVEAGKGRQR
jgi:nicotinamidase-related amidase